MQCHLGSNMRINDKYASKKLRFFSLVLDILIYCDVSWFLQIMFSMKSQSSSGLYSLVFIVFYLINGMSPGNKILNFTIKRDNGDKQSFTTKILRAILASTMFAFLPILFTSRNIGFHDMIAGTVVYQKPVNNKVISLLSIVLIVVWLLLLVQIGK